MNKLFYILLLFIFCSEASCNEPPASSEASNTYSDTSINNIPPISGAEQTELYLPMLKNKRVGLIVNHTSLIKNTHIIDSLLSLKINIVKVFAPEHGFRGMADAGETINHETDKKTGLPIISLYGKNKKPTAEQLKDIDVLIFDIQDVGVRFYTYISTMHYAIEAAAENNKEFLVLDRPNPNGFYIDGPILDMKNKSFIGMHPIPIVHGLTVGELAQMLVGEKWLEGTNTCKLKVIKVKNYTHNTRYALTVKPSPNLPNDQSVALYPSLGLFEGTNLSVGRGTQFPFQVIGYPDSTYGNFTFTPTSIPGMAKNPPHENKLCYGIDLRTVEAPQFTLKYLIDFYSISKDKATYFTNFLVKLAGTEELKTQIQKGLSEKEIKSSWAESLGKYKTMRKKYLLYTDFE